MKRIAGQVQRGICRMPIALTEITDGLAELAQGWRGPVSFRRRPLARGQPTPRRDEMTSTVAFWSRAHADSTGFYGNDAPRFEVPAVLLQYRDAQFCLLGRRQSDQPHDTAVRLLTDDGEFAVVLVERDENP